MVKHGRAVRCPFGRPIRKRPAKTVSRSARELASIEAAEADWADRRCNRLQVALEGNHLPKHASPLPQSGVDAGPFDYEPPNHEANHLDDDIPAPANTHQEHISSSQYKKRRLREEENWKTVSGEMFRAYMVCASATSDWGNLATWNEDRNPECPCTPSRRRLRNIDVLDIVCM